MRTGVAHWSPMRFDRSRWPGDSFIPRGRGCFLSHHLLPVLGILSISWLPGALMRLTNRRRATAGRTSFRFEFVPSVEKLPPTNSNRRIECAPPCSCHARCILFPASTQTLRICSRLTRPGSHHQPVSWDETAQKDAPPTQFAARTFCVPRNRPSPMPQRLGPFASEGRVTKNASGAGPLKTSNTRSTVPVIRKAPGTQRLSLVKSPNGPREGRRPVSLIVRPVP